MVSFQVFLNGRELDFKHITGKRKRKRTLMMLHELYNIFSTKVMFRYDPFLLFSSFSLVVIWLLDLSTDSATPRHECLVDLHSSCAERQTNILRVDHS